MAIGDSTRRPDAWASFAGLTPLLVLSNGLSLGLALGATFLVVHSSALAAALLLPARYGRSRVFSLALLGASIAASLCGSVLRLLDPFLFEAAFARVFLVVFTIPVLGACRMPESIAERELGLESMVRGLAYAAAIILLGASREFLASGSLSLGPDARFSALLPIAAQPAGAFIMIALVAAGIKAALRATRGNDR